MENLSGASIVSARDNNRQENSEAAPASGSVSSSSYGTRSTAPRIDSTNNCAAQLQPLCSYDCSNSSLSVCSYAPHIAEAVASPPSYDQAIAMDATQDNSKKGADPKSAPGTVTAAPQRTPIPAVQPANTNMTTVANITTTERAPLNAYDGVGITCCGVEVCASSSPSTDWGWFVFVVVFFALVFAFVCAILWIVNGRGDSGAGVGAPGSV